MNRLDVKSMYHLVRPKGFEPLRTMCVHRALDPACLPVSPQSYNEVNKHVNVLLFKFHDAK